MSGPFGFLQIHDLFAYETLTATSTSVATVLTQATFLTQNNTAYYALISVEAQSIRWTADGTTPVGNATSSQPGHLQGAGDVIEVFGSKNIKNFKVVADGSAVTAILRVSYAM